MPTDAMARPSALTLGPNSTFAAPGFGGRTPRSPLDRSPLDRPRTSPLRSSSLRSEISSEDDDEEDQSAASSTSSNDSNDSAESEDRRPFALPQRQTRVRFSPMTPANTSGNKSQPLARALLNRALTPNNAQPKKTTKIIVPTKTIRTTFELGLTSNELARKS